MKKFIVFAFLNIFCAGVFAQGVDTSRIQICKTGLLAKMQARKNLRLTTIAAGSLACGFVAYKMFYEPSMSFNDWFNNCTPVQRNQIIQHLTQIMNGPNGQLQVPDQSWSKWFKNNAKFIANNIGLTLMTGVGLQFIEKIKAYINPMTFHTFLISESKIFHIIDIFERNLSASNLYMSAPNFRYIFNNYVKEIEKILAYFEILNDSLKKSEEDPEFSQVAPFINEASNNLKKIVETIDAILNDFESYKDKNEFIEKIFAQLSLTQVIIQNFIIFDEKFTNDGLSNWLFA